MQSWKSVARHYNGATLLFDSREVVLMTLLHHFLYFEKYTLPMFSNCVVISANHPFVMSQKRWRLPDTSFAATLSLSYSKNKTKRVRATAKLQREAKRRQEAANRGLTLLFFWGSYSAGWWGTFKAPEHRVVCNRAYGRDNCTTAHTHASPSRSQCATSTYATAWRAL